VIFTVAALLAVACGGDGGTTEPDENETGTEAAGGGLSIAADTVSGPLNLPADGTAGGVCVLKSMFPRNSEIVWRARVMDPSGEALDDTAIDTMVVELGDGQTLEMRYGDHPRDNPTDQFWTTSFDIPEDYPTGTLDYTIMATSTDGRTASYKPFNVAPSLLTITDDVLETIEEEES
jgi:hypothetical protein